MYVLGASPMVTPSKSHGTNSGKWLHARSLDCQNTNFLLMVGELLWRLDHFRLPVSPFCRRLKLKYRSVVLPGACQLSALHDFLPPMRDVKLRILGVSFAIDFGLQKELAARSFQIFAW